MNSEESYLDSLLRNILNPEAAELGKDKTQIDTVAEEQAIQKSQLEETETDKTESMTVNLQLLDIPENLTEKKETSVLEGVTDTLEKPSIVEGITEELLIPEKVSEDAEETNLLEEPLLLEDLPDSLEETNFLEEIQKPEEVPAITEEISLPEEMVDVSEESLITEETQVLDLPEDSLSQLFEDLPENMEETNLLEEPLLSEDLPDSLEETNFLEEIQKPEEVPAITEEISLPEEMVDVSEESLITEETQVLDLPEDSLSQLFEDLPENMEETNLLEEPLLSEDLPDSLEEPLLSGEQLEISEIPEKSPQSEEVVDLSEEGINDLEETSILDLTTDIIDTNVIESAENTMAGGEIQEIKQSVIENESDLETELLAVDQFETEEVATMDTIDTKEINAEESALATEGPSDSGGEFSLEDKEMPESDDDLKLEDIEIPELSDLGVFQDNELNLDGLEDAIQSETELEMAGELNIDELGIDSEDLTMPMPDFNMSDFNMPDLEMQETEVLSSSEKDLDISIPDISESSDILGESDNSINMDDNLEDVLNMLDDDAELAEINDMLKKSDNNEPIQDDMMDLLNQMADDEAASVNAGLNHTDEDDGGVPLPVIPQSVLEETKTEEKIEHDESKNSKKASAKKKKKNKETEDAEVESKKQPGKLGKFFNMLTEDLVPEPTEEELAAEKEAKKAKKQEEQTKKEEEKLAQEEEKKAKAEEKAAAKKAKQEEAAKKKQEKKAQKEAKKAKQAENGANKRIPPKKIAVVAAFGASVGGAVLVATNVLSTQGFLQTARNAYYEQDYKTVYQATYGMELAGKETESLIKKKSEIIYKIQRKYDSYQNNLKMGRELEALDALLQGLLVYDTINTDAEAYEVTTEVDELKTMICSTLETKYHLDETQARTLLSNEDPLTYTIALNDVITQN